MKGGGICIYGVRVGKQKKSIFTYVSTKSVMKSKKLRGKTTARQYLRNRKVNTPKNEMTLKWLSLGNRQ
jgi:hypothetical protein